MGHDYTRLKQCDLVKTTAKRKALQLLRREGFRDLRLIGLQKLRSFFADLNRLTRAQLEGLFAEVSHSNCHLKVLNLESVEDGSLDGDGVVTHRKRLHGERSIAERCLRE